MKVSTIILRNFSRRKMKIVLNTFGLILAVALIVSTYFVSSSMSMKIGDEVEKYGPNIVVKTDSRSLTIPYGNIVVGQSTFPEKYADLIYNITNSKNIRVVSPKLFGEVSVNNQTYLVVGIVPQQESMLKVWWNFEGRLPLDDSNEAMIGSSLKSLLNTNINQTLHLSDYSLSIVSVLSETGSMDDYTIFLPLHTAQNILGQQNQVTLIDVGAWCGDCPVEEISQQISNIIPNVKVTPVKQAVQTRIKAVEQATDFSFLLASVVLVAGCAGMMNTMLSYVQERKKEIGVFMSLGADDNYIYRMFLYESVIIGAIGGVLGSIMGLLVSVFLGPIFAEVNIELQNMPLFIIPTSILLSIFASVVSSLYPARKALEIDPVDVLKSV